MRATLPPPPLVPILVQDSRLHQKCLRKPKFGATPRGEKVAFANYSQGLKLRPIRNYQTILEGFFSQIRPQVGGVAPSVL